MDKPLISVVIPMYNSQNYIEQCLLSVLSQTYRSFEVYLIDDGSTDASLKVAQKTINGDSRFHVITIPNSGQGAARFEGIRLAKGEYITFLDSDDFVEPEWLACLQMAAQSINADIVCTNYSDYYAEKEKFVITNYDQSNKMITKLDAYIEWCEDKRFKGFLWNKLYRLDVVKKHNNKLDFSFLEDSYLNLVILRDANRIYFENRSLYNYRFHKDSSIHATYSAEQALSLETIQHEMETVINNFPELRDYMHLRNAKLELMVLSNMSLSDLKKKKSLLKEFYHYFRSAPDKQSKFFNSVDRILFHHYVGVVGAYLIFSLRKSLVSIQRLEKQFKA